MPNLELNEIKDFFEKLINQNLNSYSSRSLKEIVETINEQLLYTHRTLQQSFWRLIRDLAIKYYEYTKTFHDKRNEDSVELCKIISEFGNLTFI